MPQTPAPYQPRPGGSATELNVTGAAVVVKDTPGTLYRVSINTTSAVSVTGVYDAISVSTTNPLGVTAANHIYDIPINATGVQEFEWPCKNGITIVPGTNAVLSISYE